MNYCLYRKIGDQSTVCTADDVQLSVYFYTNIINLKPALCASVFGLAPETFMFNASDTVSEGSCGFSRSMCVVRGRNRELQHHSQQLGSSVQSEKGLVVRT